MANDYVLLRCFNERLAVATVHEVIADIVLVLPPDGQGSDLMPIGFRRRDVFVLDERARDAMKGASVRWDTLTPYEKDQ